MEDTGIEPFAGHLRMEAQSGNLLGPITRWEFPMTLWKFYCNEDAYPSMWQRWFLNQ
jgi:hypothetical protein